MASYNVEVTKPMGIIFEENEPEVGGLYVAELVPDGAAAATGAIGVDDQLVAVGSTPVTGLDFDTVMAALQDSPSPATLEFFRGSAQAAKANKAAPVETEQEAAATATAARPGKTCVVVQQKEGGPVEFDVIGERLLRTAMLENKAAGTLYGGMAKLTNCGGTGQCGTCMVDVVNVSDEGVLSGRTEVEERRLKKRPASVRLACQVVLQGGDVTVKTQP